MPYSPRIAALAMFRYALRTSGEGYLGGPGPIRSYGHEGESYGRLGQSLDLEVNVLIMQLVMLGALQRVRKLIPNHNDGIVAWGLCHRRAGSPKRLPES